MNQPLLAIFTQPVLAHFSLAALACHLQASQLYIPTMRGCPGVVFRFCLSWTHMFLCWVQVIQTDTFFFWRIWYLTGSLVTAF
ncbi:hypothetical protein DFH07DRAFT_508156 [Mycena maculata]|uniref:Secreted protein n=1 Tax=Mycena maculata TaxID=230809 RepID=A0AAD7K6L8_9AGAR|nr:hypothetical protein DFH07DRAFT_508156 [Mycena maculata]